MSGLKEGMIGQYGIYVCMYEFSKEIIQLSQDETRFILENEFRE